MFLITFTIPVSDFEPDEWDSVIVEQQGGATPDDEDVVLVSQAVVRIEGGPGRPTKIHYPHGAADVLNISVPWVIE